MKLFVALLCAAAGLWAEPPGVYAVRGARVVTGGGTVLESGTVLLRDGLIEAVGENVAIPQDAWVIEGKGMTVYPGLIDALSEVGLPAPAAGAPGAAAATPAGRGGRGAAMLQTPTEPVVHGPRERPFTTTWLRAADEINPADPRITEFRSAGFTTAVVFPSSGIFAGQGVVIDLGGKERRDMVVASPAGQYVSFAPRGFRAYPGSLMGMIAYVRQVYLDAGHYQVERAAYEQHHAGMRRPEYDRAVEGLLESPRVLLPADSAVQLQRMERFAAELKTAAVLYGGSEAYRVADELGAQHVPVLVSLKWPEKARDGDPAAHEELRTLELRDRAPSSPVALAKAGTPFAFYSGGTAAREIRAAVRKAMTAGLTEAQAVRALTLGAAEIYGVSDRLGSLEKGKIANLVVTTGALFEEKTKVQYIFVDGVKYQPAPEAPPAGPPAGRGRGGVE